MASNKKKEESKRGRRDSITTFRSGTLAAQERLIYDTIDKDRDGSITQTEFTLFMMNVMKVDISEVEIKRLYVQLVNGISSSVLPSKVSVVAQSVPDVSVEGEETRVLTRAQFSDCAMKWRWLRNIIAEWDVTNGSNFTIPSIYDYTKSTSENYANPNKFEFFGEYMDIRKELDYNYHDNYSGERQLWQDRVINALTTKTESVGRPWVIYTCGPMG